MRKKLFTLLLAVAVSVGTVFASNTQVDGIWYNFNSSTLTAEVTYRGSGGTSYYNEYKGAFTIPSSVTYNGKTYSVTSIGNYAFYNCPGLTSVEIPNSVTSIGNSAFYGCTGLTSIEIPNSVPSIANNAFQYCSGLTSIEIPNNVTSIGKCAFQSCTGLTSITINQGVTIIGSSAFNGCTGLTSVEIPNSVTSIGSQVFRDCTGLTSVTIPNSVISIGDEAFSSCNNLTSIEIPNGVTSIGDGAFSGCTGLNSVEIPNSITRIGNFTFSSCTRLTSIEIPNSVDSIGEYAFSSCSGLTSIKIPNSVTYIGRLAFIDCIGLTSVTISNSLTNIGYEVFGGCTGLTSVEIPNSVTSIAGYAFSGCTGLTSIEIPNSVTYIGYYAFSSCSSLISVTIPSNITSIGVDAFLDCNNITSVSWNAKNCSRYYFGSQVISFTFGEEVEIIPNNICSGMNRLTSISIPNRVTAIGDSAFTDCTGLTSLSIPNSVSSIGDNAFKNCNIDKIRYSGTTQEWIDKLWNVNKISSNYTLHIGDELLEDLIILQSNANVKDSAFYGCSSLTSLTVPNTVTGIGKWAFGDCDNLVSVTLNSNAVTKETYTSSFNLSTLFGKQVKEYIIGENVENIGDYAFCQSDRLLSVTIPNTVNSIGSCAFLDCDGLATVTFDGIIPPTNGGAVFDACPNLKTIYVPCENVVSAYSQKWSEYSKLFQPLLINEITLNVDSIQGSVDKIDVDTVCGKHVISATPNYGYNFVQWSDGVYDNPRTIIIDKDTSITAIFAPNIYTFSATCDEAYGIVEAANGEYPYLTELTISAKPHYGYHFARWSDNNVSNPRTITIERDSALVAFFAPNRYVLSGICDGWEGYIDGTGVYDYLSVITITAFAKDGYHFDTWSDGVSDNPRTIELTQDTTFEAVFAKNIYVATVKSDNEEQGSVTGGGSYEYESQVTISATPNYGYHFAQWKGIGPHIPQNAISVSQAFAIASALDAGQRTSTRYHIVGYVTGTYASYSNSYYLSDDPQVPGNFIAFKCASSVHIGDYVWVTGYLTNYNGDTPETTSGSAITKIDIFSNPYYFTLTCDTTIIAKFAKNIYTLTVQSADTTMGAVSNGGEYEYLTKCEMRATPKYGYHFAQWSDGNTDNPRTIELTRDTTISAIFGKNPVIRYICDHSRGYIEGETTLASQASGDITFRAIPLQGLRFAQWADGTKDNPRTIFLDRDTTMEALFDFELEGRCGKDMALTWTLDSTTLELSIEGEGELTENYTYCSNINSVRIGKDVSDIGLEAFEHCFGITHVTLNSAAVVGKDYYYYYSSYTGYVYNTLTAIFGSGVEEYTFGGQIERIGSYAFYGSNKLTKVVIPEGCKYIGEYAFDNCGNIITIVCPSTVEYIGKSAFDSESIMNVYDYAITPQDMSVTNPYSGYALTLLRGVLATARLYVPEQSIELYREAYFWCYFGNILPIQVTSVDVNDIRVTTTESTVTVLWPQINGAATYELVIRDKSGNSICILVFNADGQLTQMVFNAPSRERAPQQTQTAGFSFTVTGLESNTGYNLTMTAKNSNGATLQTKTISFVTNCLQTLDNISDTPTKATKLLHNNQILILRGEKVYTLQGQEVK